MYLRCSRCHEPTWIRSLVPGLVERTIACQDCGQEHELDRVSELGETAKEQYAAANAFADGNGVDLPTAYSVLLGLMSLDDARGVDAEKKDQNRREAAAKATPDLPPEPVAAPAPRPRPRKRPRKKPTPAADRESPREQSSEETVTVHVEREMAKERKRLTWGQGILLLVLASLTLGLSGRHAYLTWRGMVEDARNAEKSTAASEKTIENARVKAEAEARATSKPAEQLETRVERDAEGRVTRVVGATPMEVLEAYCAAVSDSYPREPLELTEASPPSPAERYGVFRDFSRLESNRAIRISRMDGVNRWETGNGMRPVPTREAPDGARSIGRAAVETPR